MLDVRLHRCRRNLRKLHPAEVRNQVLDAAEGVGQRFPLVDLVVSDDELRGFGDSQILNDDRSRRATAPSRSRRVCCAFFLSDVFEDSVWFRPLASWYWIVQILL
jgi:hypothetical protein